MEFFDYVREYVQMIPTKERLAQKLHSLGLAELERRARKGDFSDYESHSAQPKMNLVLALNGTARLARLARDSKLAGLVDALAEEVKEGKWDDTKEEADAWFQREGKDILPKPHD